ncbi:MAG TPA: hypothetical protein VFZ01_09860 [Geminicoccaceae bacterium]
MPGFVLTTVWVLAFSLSVYGWGTATAAVAALEPGPWALRMTLGLASCVFLGGILNLLHLAHPEAVGLVLALGILIAIASIIRRLRTAGPGSGEAAAAFIGRTATDRLAIPGIIVFLALAYVYLTAGLVPTDIFNPHDDLQTYLARPLRMLQTGSLAASPFTPIGVDSLGAQAFLQSFLLAYLPIRYVNAFDAIFCFLLLALLLLQLGHRLGLPPSLAALAIALFVAINPQYVNVSSVYSGSLMIVGLVFAALDVDLDARPTLRQVRRLLPLALFMAALLALKTTFVVFVAGFALACSAASLLLARDRLMATGRMVVLGLLTCVAIAPWAATFAEEYATALDLWLGAAAASADPASGSEGPFEPRWSLLSLSTYGGSLLQYHALALLGVLLAIPALAALTQRTQWPRAWPPAVLLASCVGASLAYAVNLLVFNPITAVRYSCPILAGALPAGLLLALAVSGPAADRTPRRGLLALVLLVIVSFAPVLMLRLDRIGRHHTLVSFPLHEEHVAISAAALDDGARASLARAQERTPPGSVIMAHTATPFYLDHAHNTVLTVVEPGLLNPWLGLPVGGAAGELRAHLRDRGVQYVLWDYRRQGMKPDRALEGYLRSPYEVYRRIGTSNLWLRRALDRMMADGGVVYRDERRAVFEISPEAGLADAGR